jgi:hypothetical protein
MNLYIHHKGLTYKLMKGGSCSSCCFIDRDDGWHCTFPLSKIRKKYCYINGEYKHYARAEIYQLLEELKI